MNSIKVRDHNSFLNLIQTVDQQYTWVILRFMFCRFLLKPNGPLPVFCTFPTLDSGGRRWVLPWGLLSWASLTQSLPSLPYCCWLPAVSVMTNWIWRYERKTYDSRAKQIVEICTHSPPELPLFLIFLVSGARVVSCRIWGGFSYPGPHLQREKGLLWGSNPQPGCKGSSFKKESG